VDIRKRLGDELLAEMNDKVYEFSQAKTVKKKTNSLPIIRSLKQSALIKVK
jgi:hypothetical protein